MKVLVYIFQNLQLFLLTEHHRMHWASMAACHKRPSLWSSGLPCSRWGWTFNNSFIDKTIVMCFFGVVNEVFDRFRGAA
jgi:hypothetical protein